MFRLDAKGAADHPMGSQNVSWDTRGRWRAEAGQQVEETAGWWGEDRTYLEGREVVQGGVWGRRGAGLDGWRGGGMGGGG